jgi:uncharacterized protein (TIGR02246 family)
MDTTFFPADASQADVTALIGRVAELERTQVSEDVGGFVALFDPGAVWVTGGGRRLIGLDPIAEFTRSVLPGAMADGSVVYEVEHVLMIAPDVALTGVCQRYLDHGGRTTSAGLPTYVWKRSGETWLIVSGQNTGVPGPDGEEGEAAGS